MVFRKAQMGYCEDDLALGPYCFGVIDLNASAWARVSAMQSTLTHTFTTPLCPNKPNPLTERFPVLRVF